MKIIYHAWRSYTSKLVKIWRDHDAPFHKYKDMTKEDWARIVEKCDLENFATNSECMQWLRSQNELDHHLNNTGYAESKGSGNKGMKDWPSKVLRIHATIFVDGWGHLCVLLQLEHLRGGSKGLKGEQRRLKW
jgi:hypothetical protein